MYTYITTNYIQCAAWPANLRPSTLTCFTFLYTAIERNFFYLSLHVPSKLDLGNEIFVGVAYCYRPAPLLAQYAGSCMKHLTPYLNLYQ